MDRDQGASSIELRIDPSKRKDSSLLGAKLQNVFHLMILQHWTSIQALASLKCDWNFGFVS
jgi:hypothetical protein